LKGAKLEDLEDVLVIWIVQVHANNGTSTDEVIKEQAKNTLAADECDKLCKQKLVFCSKK
jgi:hypothetical protein